MKFGSFHEVLLPEDISINASGGPAFLTNVAALRSGAEERRSQWSRAKRRYDIGYGLRDANELYAVYEFFLARMGQGFPFRFRDPRDFTTKPGTCECEDTTAFDDCLIELSEATSTEIPLYRTYRSGQQAFRRRIYKPRCCIKIGLTQEDGTQTELTGGFEVNPSRGVVCFDSLPVGKCLTWGGLYDTPVRFAVDELDWTMEMLTLSEFPSIPLIEVLGEKDVLPETEDDELQAFLGVADSDLQKIVDCADEIETEFTANF